MCCKCLVFFIQLTVGRSHWKNYTQDAIWMFGFAPETVSCLVNARSVARKSWLACATVSAIHAFVSNPVRFGGAVQLRSPSDSLPLLLLLFLLHLLLFFFFFFVCLFVCLLACLLVCLIVSFFVSLFVSLFLCFFVSLFLCFFVSLFLCFFVCLFVCVCVCLCVCVSAWLAG